MNILLGGNKLSETTYEAKKVVCPLGLESRRYTLVQTIVSSIALRSTRTKNSYL